ncbi:MAG: V-type ATPase subunit [Ruminococcus sp.]|nr:V-type ATPase subunit [Ruminococcus sp.]
MAKADYTYAVARIRSKELKLLTMKDLEALISLDDYESCIRFLTEKGWGNDTNQTGDDILSTERKKIWLLMNELVKEENAFDAFLLQNDFHNLKVTIKAITRNLKADNMFSEFGKVPAEKIYEAIDKRNYSQLPEYLQNTAKEAMNTLLHTSDGQLCDIIIDKACLEAVYNAGKNSDDEIIKLYSELFVASADIKIAVRCAKTNKILDFIKQSLAECETLNINMLANSAAKGIDEICSYLSSSAYKEAVEALKKSPSAFEKYCDDLVTDKMKTQKWEPFTIGPLIAFIIARENEIKAVRIILSAKLNSLDTEIVKERLRKMYV